MAAGRHIGFDLILNSAIRFADPEKPTVEPNTKSVDRMTPCVEIGHSQFSKMATSCRLGFDRTGNSAILPAFPENPTLV